MLPGYRHGLTVINRSCLLLFLLLYSFSDGVGLGVVSLVESLDTGRRVSKLLDLLVTPDKPLAQPGTRPPSTKQFLASLYLPRWNEATPDLRKALAARGELAPSPPVSALRMLIALSLSLLLQKVSELLLFHCYI